MSSETPNPRKTAVARTRSRLRVGAVSAVVIQISGDIIPNLMFQSDGGLGGGAARGFDGRVDDGDDQQGDSTVQGRGHQKRAAAEPVRQVVTAEDGDPVDDIDGHQDEMAVE